VGSAVVSKAEDESHSRVRLVGPDLRVADYGSNQRLWVTGEFRIRTPDLRHSRPGIHGRLDVIGREEQVWQRSHSRSSRVTCCLRSPLHPRFARMNSAPNKAPAPNRRPRFHLGGSGGFEYYVSAPPASPAAVGDARRSTETA